MAADTRAKTKAVEASKQVGKQTNKQHKRNDETNKQTAVIIQSETNVSLCCCKKGACPALEVENSLT